MMHGWALAGWLRDSHRDAERNVGLFPSSIWQSREGSFPNVHYQRFEPKVSHRE